MKINAIICGLAVCIAPSVAQAQSVLTFPEGAVQNFETVKTASSYLVPLSAFEDGAVLTEAAEGVVTQQVWRTVDGQTETLNLLAPLRDQLKTAGYDILFECETRNCGGFDFRFNTDVVKEPDMHVDLGDFRFLSAKKLTVGKPDYVGLMISKSAERGYIQVTTVGEKPAGLAEIVVSTKQPPATEEPLTLAKVLSENGSAPLDGLVFANGASGLDSASGETLHELALFMANNPTQSVILVGHTDASGSLSGNLALSRKRATSVMQELIDTFGVGQERLTAEGIGYLAPRASNDTEDGRKLNRRVEVVLTSTN